MVYLNRFNLPDEDNEWRFFVYGEKRTCFNTYYPFQIFPKMEFDEIEFEPVTIFYGGNGTGKTTLLNIIAEKLKVTRNSVFNRSNFFDIYVSKCRADLLRRIPPESRIITSDDVFDYMIDVRNLNDGIHNKREEFKEFIVNLSLEHGLTSFRNIVSTQKPQIRRLCLSAILQIRKLFIKIIPQIRVLSRPL